MYDDADCYNKTMKSKRECKNGERNCKTKKRVSVREGNERDEGSYRTRDEESFSEYSQRGTNSQRPREGGVTQDSNKREQKKYQRVKIEGDSKRRERLQNEREGAHLFS